nr:DUF3592 domain-containing protein [uncultured Desulfuromonas sp.]
MFLIITLTVALALILYLASQVYLGSRSQWWPSTQGKLLAFKINQFTRRAKFPSLQKDEHYAYVSLKYEYFVDGKKFLGKRLIFGNNLYYSSPEEIALDPFLNRIKDRDFEVFYWPQMPSISTLKKGSNNKKEHIYSIYFIALVAGGLILLSSVIYK